MSGEGAGGERTPGAPLQRPRAVSRRQGSRAGAPQPTRIAAVDVGSNSVRTVVADVSARGQIRIVDELKETPRLGVGLEATGALAPEAMQRALDALARMATLVRRAGADQIVAVATSAVRDAANGAAFLAAVREHTGLELRILDGAEEARLAWRSAAAHFDLDDQRAVVMDIGGGSLELALAAGGVVERLLSHPFGAIRLTERFLADGRGREGVERLREVVREELRESISFRDWHGAMLIGSGGTFTTLAAVAQARRGLSGARTVHGTAVAREELERVLEYLQELSPAERAAVPGVSAARSEIIVAGLAVAAEVVARIEARELLVSAYGIREGLLLETARVTPQPGTSGRARDRAVLAFARRCRYEAQHARQVRRLSLQLFDVLGEALGCAPTERRTLADAALLHDVGYHIGASGHHKHAYHLIVHAELLGMSPEEQVVIANVARYHRGSHPKKKHEGYAMLPPAARARVRRLAALLRVADGFDRGHVAAVEELMVERAADGTVEIRAVPRVGAGDCRLELWGAARKAQLLAEELEAPVRVLDAAGAQVSVEDGADEGA